MKRIIIKKLGLIAVVGSGIFSFSSCLKDLGPVQDYSQSPPVISFQGNGQGTNFSAISVLPTTTQANPLVDSIGVSLGVSSLYLSKPVDVTVTADQASLDTYNGANNTNYTLLNPNAYALANAGIWTIPAGKNLRYFNVSLIGANIDFTKSNALALKISNAPGTTIASNLNTYVLIINLKSLFENDYDISGTRTRYNGATVGSGV
ncbi:MAG TPA: DUF1735 domain-containing protein, partial [Puia sp.]|nr:DUF1735 domain-containing protein [Puia sp.]